jgi:rhamnose transport system permease protein
MVGVLLSNYLVLNIRNGMIISGITGNTQTGVIGLMLILSVLIPNLVGRVQERRRQHAELGVRAPPAGPVDGEHTQAAPG